MWCQGERVRVWHQGERVRVCGGNKELGWAFIITVYTSTTIFHSMAHTHYAVFIELLCKLLVELVLSNEYGFLQRVYMYMY